MISKIGDYIIDEDAFLGRGTFGAVYRATKDGKHYAIKSFQTDFLQTDIGKERALREVKALQLIDHPNVVKIHDYGTFEEQNFEYFYIIMDYVPGKTLDHLSGAVTEDRLIALATDIFRTLEAVHKTAIHRDLKPTNIIIRPDGSPVILDFGLAKLIDYSSITQTGDVLGTYAYMSPEQVTDSKNVNETSDYFAMGVILYQLITGELPYDAKNVPALIEQIKNQYPKLPSITNPEVSNKLENAILKLLEKKPYERYQNVDEVINALQTETPSAKKLLQLENSFLIRLQHTEKATINEALKAGLVSSVIFPANLFLRYHPTVTLLKASGVRFLADPATNRLTYTAFSNTQGLRELPYSSGDEVIPLHKNDLLSIRQVQDYTSKVLEFQVQNGCTELVAPFFYAKSSKDDWFDINIKLAKEAVAWRDNNAAGKPIWVGICMFVDEWHDPDEKDRLLNSYSRTNADGFLVYGDPIGNKANLPQLFHYTDFMLKLQDSTSSPVIAERIGSLGLILSSIGIAGFSSGISSLDSFSESLIAEAKEPYSPDNRYYVSGLMGFITMTGGLSTRLLDVMNSNAGSSLKCACGYCSSLFEEQAAISLQNLKLHFLYSRAKEIKALTAIEPEQRVKYITERLESAIETEKLLRSEGIKYATDTTYLRNWLRLVERFK